MHADPTALITSTRRAIVTIGARWAVPLALLGLHTSPADARKRKKKKKKKKPVRVVARLIAPEMIGENEVPPESGDQDGTGSATFLFKSNGQICADFDALNVGDVTLMHIHEGGEGVEGDPVVDFSAFVNDADLAGCVSVNSTLFNQIKANPAEFYANLHTDEFAAGAIRDQLEVAAD
jgi:hypothetical protein